MLISEVNYLYSTELIRNQNKRQLESLIVVHDYRIPSWNYCARLSCRWFFRDLPIHCSVAIYWFEIVYNVAVSTMNWTHVPSWCIVFLTRHTWPTVALFDMNQTKMLLLIIKYEDRICNYATALSNSYHRCRVRRRPKNYNANL